MRKSLNLLGVLAAMSFGVVGATQAQAANCCPNGQCGTCCQGCTHCDSHCSPSACCKQTSNAAPTAPAKPIKK